MQGLVDKEIDEELNSVEFESRLFREVKKVVSSLLQVKKMTKVMLENQDFIAPGVINIRKGAGSTVDVTSEREYWRRKLVEAAYSTNARSVSSNDRPRTSISDKRISKNSIHIDCETMALGYPATLRLSYTCQ